MKYFILAQILFLTSLVGFAQQVMLSDSITQNPVCYATVYDAIAVGTGTWGIAAVIPKYLSLRLQPERFVPLYPRKLAFTINLMLKTTKTS